MKNPDTYFLGDADHFTYKDWLIEGSGSTELWYKKSDEKPKHYTIHVRQAGECLIR